MGLRGILRVASGNRLGFYCPGCKEMHMLNIGEGRPSWGFNGNYDKPTFTPSVLVTSGHYAPGQEGKPCWCTYYKDHPEEDDGFKCICCHSYVTDGRISFLVDSSHELSGQTVALAAPPDGEPD